MRGSADRARLLRKSQTDAERRLWSRLRNRQVLGAKCANIPWETAWRTFVVPSDVW
jgi:very-short-patch-repair endonuclease